MKWKSLFLTLCALLCCSHHGFTQQSKNISVQLEKGYEQAMLYKEISLYGESIGALNKVIELAEKHNFQKQYIEASIAKAELFRKTENFDRGIELLYQLKNTERYPKLHVQKLGRLAALYAEYAYFSKEVQRDSIKAFVNEGIEISMRLGLKEEEASLRNELGFLQSRNRKFDIALSNLNRARVLFGEIGDAENEMGVRINIYDLYVGMEDFKTADSLLPILYEKIQFTHWYALQSKFYSIVSARYKTDGERIEELEWAEKSHGATVAQARLINSNQMASFKVIHDTNLFKEEAFKKSHDLALQKNKTQFLLLLIFILVFAVMVVVFIFFREKRLKTRLDQTVNDLSIMNDKYEMLIVESNHRIKNNLQMIISMLEFTKKGMQNSRTDVVQSMSGKIQTISALHKHLYVDVHNEFVDLSRYFNEILGHYKDIGLRYEVDASICAVQIRSERIVYFGLILNEMLSNTLEHGKSDTLQIKLKVEAQNGHFKFTYSDASPHASTSKKGTGTKLIQQLVRRIKGINFGMQENTGTYHFEFALK